LDITITHWLNSFAGQNAAFDAVMIFITSFGVPILIILVMLQWWSKRPRQHIRHTAVAAGLSFLLGLAINQIVLLFIQRIRPYDAGVTQLIIDRSADWSFPSDHATAVWAIVAAFALQGIRLRAGMFVLLAVLICFSRIYVGTHYVTDILGGAATAIIAVIIVKLAYRKDTKFDRWITSIF
jgi:undecaprenyl-diphosphatase